MFRIEDKIKVIGRGTVLVGKLLEATDLRQGDTVFAEGYRGRIVGIEYFASVADGTHFKKGASISLILRPQPDILEAGMVVRCGSPININRL